MERAVDERTPLTKHSPTTRFVITTPVKQQQQQQHTTTSDHSGSSTSTGNGKHRKRAYVKRHSKEFTTQARNELALLDTLIVADHTRSQINALVRDTLAMGQLTCVMFAFHIVEGVFTPVAEPEPWEQSTGLHLGEEREISENQLCLDVRRFTDKHFMIAGALLHLKRNMTSPLHCIVSRRRVTLQCKPAPESGVWWRRHFNYEKSGYYYKILIDFAQSEPMYELK